MTQKELGYVELEWTCTRCGTINPGMNRVCSNCGGPMTVSDKFELPDQQTLITDEGKLEQAKKGPAIQCPYCNVLNPGGTKICLQCGGDIEAGLARLAGEVLGSHQTAPVPDKPCPHCGQSIKVGAQRCPHCGGSLVEAEEAPQPSSASPAAPKKTPLWMIIGGAFIGMLLLAAVIALIVMGSRTTDVTARVADLHWQLSINILEKQPVQRSAWKEDVPSQAQEISCQDKYKETSSYAVPNATEVCGTPYVVDQGSGAGKVVQDCEYLVYASYCTFTVLDWTVVNTAVASGADSSPQWPVTNLQAGQQQGDRYEEYQVVFDTGEQTYTYIPLDMADFSQYDLGSQWILSINTFGSIKDLQRK